MVRGRHERKQKGREGGREGGGLSIRTTPSARAPFLSPLASKRRPLPLLLLLLLLLQLLLLLLFLPPLPLPPSLLFSSSLDKLFAPPLKRGIHPGMDTGTAGVVYRRYGSSRREEGREGGSAEGGGGQYGAWCRRHGASPGGGGRLGPARRREGGREEGREGRGEKDALLSF